LPVLTNASPSTFLAPAALPPMLTRWHPGDDLREDRRVEDVQYLRTEDENVTP